jgi:hypothetical protein
LMGIASLPPILRAKRTPASNRKNLETRENFTQRPAYEGTRFADCAIIGELE